MKSYSIVGIFSVPEEIRTDGGSKYSSSIAEDLRSLLIIQAH
jgi:hypothetical protein